MIPLTARRRIAEIGGLAALCAGVALAGAALFASVDLARAQDGGGVGGMARLEIGLSDGRAMRIIKTPAGRSRVSRLAVPVSPGRT